MFWCGWMVQLYPIIQNNNKLNHCPFKSLQPTTCKTPQELKTPLHSRSQSNSCTPQPWKALRETNEDTRSYTARERSTNLQPCIAMRWPTTFLSPCKKQSSEHAISTEVYKQLYFHFLLLNLTWAKIITWPVNHGTFTKVIMILQLLYICTNL